MTLSSPNAVVLQNVWQTLPFWLSFVAALCLTGAWYGLLVAFVLASVASLLHRTLANRRVPLASGSAVLVTGCSSGIGRAAVVRLLHDGWLVFACVRRESDASSLRSELRDHARLRVVLLDISDERRVEAAAAEVRAELKQRSARLTALVCNAGYAEHSPIELLPLQLLRAQFATNVFGTASVVRHFTPLLRESTSAPFSAAASSLRSPRVVLLSSVTGHFTVPGLGAYSASKYALQALGDSLRQELHGSAIAVSLVEPGQTDTHFNATVQHTGQHIARQQPTSAVSGVASVADSVRSQYARAYNRFFHQLLPADAVSTGVDAIELALTDSAPLARYRSGWTSLPTEPFLLLPTEVGDILMGWWYR